jgi:hypothetical protein
VILWPPLQPLVLQTTLPCHSHKSESPCFYQANLRLLESSSFSISTWPTTVIGYVDGSNLSPPNYQETVLKPAFLVSTGSSYPQHINFLSFRRNYNSGLHLGMYGLSQNACSLLTQRHESCKSGINYLQSRRVIYLSHTTFKRSNH